MTTLLWFFVAYALTITISYKPILQYLKTKPDITGPFTSEFVAGVVAFIPVYNMVEAIKVWIYRYKVRKSNEALAKATDKLREHFKNHADPEVKDAIMGIADKLQDYTRSVDEELKNKEK